MIPSQTALLHAEGNNYELEILEKWNGILVASLKKVS